MTKIKICGLKRPEDIEIINKYQPDYCGFIIDFPKSHRNLTPTQVRKLSSYVDRKNITAVGVFVNEPVENVAALLNDGSLDMAQLHGEESEEYIKTLRSMTDKKIIQAFTVKEESGLNAAASSSADHILLDQGRGSGKIFDWSVLGSSKAAAIFPPNGVPTGEWFLAGGLNEDNIEDAISRFRPYAVDLSSAVETNELKDEIKIRRIIEIVRSCR